VRRRRLARAAAAATLVIATASAACGGDEADWDAWCADAAVADGAGPVFPDPAAERPEPDPAALAALRALGASAPAPVADDVGVLVAAVDAVLRTLDAGPVDPEAPLPYDPEAVAAARSVVVDTARERCDVDLESPLG
jgi:hypothetical protein